MFQKFENTNTNKEKVSNHDPVPQVSELRSSKAGDVLLCKTMSETCTPLSGRQRLGQMRAELWGCVKYSGEGCQECTHKNARVDHREGEREGRNHLVCSSTAARVAVRSSGCFTLGTAPKIPRQKYFHDLKNVIPCRHGCGVSAAQRLKEGWLGCSFILQQNYLCLQLR